MENDYLLGAKLLNILQKRLILNTKFAFEWKESDLYVNFLPFQSAFYMA